MTVAAKELLLSWQHEREQFVISGLCCVLLWRSQSEGDSAGTPVGG